MNCEPDFVNLIWGLGLLMISGGILYWTIEMDCEWRRCKKREIWAIWCVVCLATQLGFLGAVAKTAPFPKVCLLILASYLVVCVTMDSVLCKVNDFMQYIGVVGGVLWVLYDMPQKEVGISLMFFAVAQCGVFGRMYGSADVMAFLICALYLAGQNKEIEAYLLHMSACYLMLAVVQMIRKNINEKGNLKVAVPLYPYISAGFLLIFYQ